MKQLNATNRDITELYKAILTLETVDECKKFFRDLCTLAELDSMAERFKVLKMLNQGISYREINKKTKLSTATITRIAHWLHHGEGGYKLMLERLK